MPIFDSRQDLPAHRGIAYDGKTARELLHIQASAQLKEVFMRYNNLPGSIHFMPYLTGVPKKGTHVSHTKSYIYCKTTFTAGEYDFEYVERRALDKKAAEAVRLIDYGDLIRATNLFEAMNSDFRHELDVLSESVVNFEAAAQKVFKLWSMVISTDDHDKQNELTSEIDLLREDMWEKKQSIDNIIQEINKESKFNAKTKMIGKSKAQPQAINEGNLIHIPA